MSKLVKASLFLLSSFIIINLYILQVAAHSPFAEQFIYSYNQRYSCILCHDEKGLNVFGKDFHKAYKESRDTFLALKNIKNIDSDGDGFINDVELIKGTLPGDKSNYPK